MVFWLLLDRSSTKVSASSPALGFLNENITQVKEYAYKRHINTARINMKVMRETTSANIYVILRGKAHPSELTTVGARDLGQERQR